MPSEEFVRLEGGDMSRGDRGGVVRELASADQIVCPGKEPKLPVPALPPLFVEALQIETQPFATTERGHE